MQDGEPYLAGTARPVVALMSAATAAEAGRPTAIRSPWPPTGARSRCPSRWCRWPTTWSGFRPPACPGRGHAAEIAPYPGDTLQLVTPAAVQAGSTIAPGWARVTARWSP